MNKDIAKKNNYLWLVSTLKDYTHWQEKVSSSLNDDIKALAKQGGTLNMFRTPPSGRMCASDNKDMGK